MRALSRNSFQVIDLQRGFQAGCAMVDEVRELVGERLLDRVGRVVRRIDVRGRREVEELARVVAGAALLLLQIAAGEERDRRLLRERREHQADVAVLVEIGLDAEHHALARQDAIVEVREELRDEGHVEVRRVRGRHVGPHDGGLADGDRLHVDRLHARALGHLDLSRSAEHHGRARGRRLARELRVLPLVGRDRAAREDGAVARALGAVESDGVVDRGLAPVEARRADDQREPLVAVRRREALARHAVGDRELRDLAGREHETHDARVGARVGPRIGGSDGAARAREEQQAERRKEGAHPENESTPHLE